ncbi:putative neutral sphingomyelinase [Orussus abietinus]|uniref:putative neutral sphingomyelinase n=1 Tax=Orussus abietinus TaxID=222816 RepID=UPI00062606F7|nr:putative neutral sphingomyelinase [Orussus abietinus]
MADDILLRVLTLNCWGIPYVSKNWIARLQAIIDKLTTDEYDIVCLQEIWSSKDFEIVQAKVKDHLPHAHYFYSGVYGSGMCILSRYPIQDVMFHKWALNGYVHKIHHGDWFGGKGVGLCKIMIRDIVANVYTAHLHAEYDKENDEYTAHRVLQAFDTAQFIRMTKGGADVIILGGDLNTEPQDLAYRIICGTAGMVDACSISSNIQGTNMCANNSYTNSKCARKEPQGKRIDYILYLGSTHYNVEVTDFKHPFPERIPSKPFSYSDHEAVMAHFKLTRGEREVAMSDVKDTLKEALDICDLALRDVKRQRCYYLLIGGLLAIPVIWSMGIDCFTQSIGLSIGANILRLLLTATLCYVLFMSSIWNSVERNALTAGSLAMTIHLEQLKNNSSNNIPEHRALSKSDVTLHGRETLQRRVAPRS